MTTATVDPAADHVFLMQAVNGGQAVRIEGSDGRDHLRSDDCPCHPTLQGVTFENLADLPDPSQPLRKGLVRAVWVHRSDYDPR